MDPLDPQPSAQQPSTSPPEFVAAARHVVEELPVSSDDVRSARVRLQAAMQRTAGDRPRHSPLRRMPRAAWYTAMGTCLGVLLLVLGWQAGTYRLNSRMSSSTSIYTTARGERATITLPDGSTAILNVATRLEVPVDYAAGNRIVHLTGAALFDVAHQQGSPFTVVAGAGTARVLGTRFVVRHYASDSLTTVAVQDGRVAVQSAILAGGDQITVGPQGNGTVQPVDASVFSFVSGLLTLTNVPLPTAIPELNRWYDADIRLGNPSLASRRMTGSYDAGSLAELQMILEMTFNARVVRDGRTLTLFPR